MKTLRRAAIVFGVAVSAGAHAYTIDTYPFWDNNITSGWFAVAQSFVVDPTDNMLVAYKFGMAGGSGNVTFSILPWDINVGPTGAAVYSTVVGWPGVDSDVSIGGINTVLTPNATYAAIVDLQGSSATSVHYMANNVGNPTGHASWFNNTWQFLGGSGFSTQFRADFRPVPEPTTVVAIGSALIVLVRRRRGK